MRFYQRGRSKIWVGTADVGGLTSARIDAVGIHLLRIGGRYWKPTSAAIVAFGANVRDSVIELRRDEVAAFFAGSPIPVAADDPRREGLRRGYLAARHAGVALGCAEWHAGEALTPLVPKNQRIADIDL